MKKILEKSLVGRLNSEMKGGEKMKKVSRFLMLAVAAIMLMAGSAMALPFNSLGWVNPNIGNSWDATSSTGTAQYSFVITDIGKSADKLELAFENDVFDISAIDASSFTIINPGDWGSSTFTETTSVSGGTTKWSISTAGSTLIDSTIPLIIEFNYKLLGADRYSSGSGTGWEWDEAQGANAPWSQAYYLAGPNDTNSGGSTAPVPEPATLILLGSGLAGLALYGRRKKTI